MTNLSIIVMTVFFIGFAPKAFGQLEDLDKYIEEARQQWDVPGMTVTVVHNHKIVLSKGYGVRSLHSQESVDANTLFMLGSTTKAMTAAAMAMLVDEGKVKWEDRVIDHLSWFQLHDPYITRELTIKDLFTHNSGLGNADLLWTLWNYSTEEIVKRLKFLPASYSMRGGYTYQNIMYATAGLIIEKLSGMSWNEFVRQRIFDPLDMSRTCALKSCAEQYSNRSKPHYPTADGIIEIIDSNADSISAAGSAWSCSNDISKWMQFVLDSAEINGTKLISEQNFRILHKPHIIIPDGRFYPSVKFTKPNFTAYSLGWFLHDYKGEFVQFHTGSLNGSGAIIGLIPEQNLGVYIMVNLDHAEVRHALMYKVFDYFLDLGDRDWSTDLKAIYDERSAASDEDFQRMTDSREHDTKCDFEPREMIGIYSNNFLGELKVSESPQGLEISCRDDRNLSLEHWHYNTFLGKIKEYKHDRGSLVDFDRDANGGISVTLYGYEFNKEQ